MTRGALGMAQGDRTRSPMTKPMQIADICSGSAAAPLSLFPSLSLSLSIARLRPQRLKSLRTLSVAQHPAKRLTAQQAASRHTLDAAGVRVCMPPSKLARKVGMCLALIAGGPRRESGPLEMCDVISTLVCKQHPN